jgi:A/G-specific adenine glycosylase
MPCSSAGPCVKSGHLELSPAFAPDATRVRRIGRALLRWYALHKRALPWRETRDPYVVWVSEMMLQQTQVSTVVPYFERWMRRFPDLEALARADESEVLHAWQGLGYYSRARSLLQGARQVRDEHGGRIPDDVATLRTLPGIGPYSAGAIASIAFGKPEPLVDGNVVRVLTRLFALRGDPKKEPLKAGLWLLARTLVQHESPGDFNQALMELGATLCAPRAPRCAECSLAKHCAAKAAGLVEELPELAARPKPTLVRMAAAIASQNGTVLIHKLGPDAARWAGMWQFPNRELGPDEAPEAAARRALAEQSGIEAAFGPRWCSIQHSVTRYRITLEVYRTLSLLGCARAADIASLAWVKPDELGAFAMPAAHRRIASALVRLAVAPNGL